MTACSGTPLLKRGEYNIGGCSTESFAALHIVITGTTFTAVRISDSPKTSEAIDHPPVFTFVKKDAEGLHYASEFTEVVIKFKDGYLLGVLKVGGEVKSLLYGAKGTEANLLKDGENFFKVCQKILPVPQAPETN